jgi:hypothetical protein
MNSLGFDTNTLLSIVVILATAFNSYLTMQTQLEVAKLKVYMLENFVMKAGK